MSRLLVKIHVCPCVLQLKVNFAEQARIAALKVSKQNIFQDIGRHFFFEEIAARLIPVV